VTVSSASPLRSLGASLTGPRGILVITGTSTGVGKTVVTAAIAGLASAAGRSVTVVKPAQTGVDPAAPDESDVPDADTVTRLSGVTDTHELARFPDPLSPEAAARRSGRPPLDVEAAADYIVKLAAERDLVLVEGAGGLLVRYDPAGHTLADLAIALARRSPGASRPPSAAADAGARAGAGHEPAVSVLIVAAAGLGTLNHTALTAEALRARGLSCAGVVIGSWPDRPGLAERENLADLPVAAGAPLAGVLPEGAGALGRQEFLDLARRGLTPALGGTRDHRAALPSGAALPSCAAGGLQRGPARQSSPARRRLHPCAAAAVRHHCQAILPARSQRCCPGVPHDASRTLAHRSAASPLSHSHRPTAALRHRCPAATGPPQRCVTAVPRPPSSRRSCATTAT